MASTIEENPSNFRTISRSIRRPVRACTALTVHCGPPTAYALVIFHSA